MPGRQATDRQGRTIFPGDTVRVVGIPDLRGMSQGGLKETVPVFRYLVGRYERVVNFDEYGNAELVFTIARGRLKGWHAVVIEPTLLRRPIQQRSSRVLRRRSARVT